MVCACFFFLSLRRRWARDACGRGNAGLCENTHRCEHEAPALTVFPATITSNVLGRDDPGTPALSQLMGHPAMRRLARGTTRITQRTAPGRGPALEIPVVVPWRASTESFQEICRPRVEYGIQIARNERSPVIIPVIILPGQRDHRCQNLDQKNCLLGNRFSGSLWRQGVRWQAKPPLP